MWPFELVQLGVGRTGEFVVGILGQQRIVVFEIVLKELQPRARRSRRVSGSLRT